MQILSHNMLSIRSAMLSTMEGLLTLIVQETRLSPPGDMSARESEKYPEQKGLGSDGLAF